MLIFFSCVERDITFIVLNGSWHSYGYQIQETVEDAVLNLNDIGEEEETTLFPMNVKFIKEKEESDNFLMANSVTVSVSASNVPTHKLKKIRKSSSGWTNEPKVHVIKEDFVLHNAS